MDPFFPFIYEPEKQNEPEHLYIEIDPPRYEREEKVDEDESPRVIIIQLWVLLKRLKNIRSFRK